MNVKIRHIYCCQITTMPAFPPERKNNVQIVKLNISWGIEGCEVFSMSWETQLYRAPPSQEPIYNCKPSLLCIYHHLGWPGTIKMCPDIIQGDWTELDEVLSKFSMACSWVLITTKHWFTYQSLYKVDCTIFVYHNQYFNDINSSGNLFCSTLEQVIPSSGSHFCIVSIKWHIFNWPLR